MCTFCDVHVLEVILTLQLKYVYSNLDVNLVKAAAELYL